MTSMTVKATSWRAR